MTSSSPVITHICLLGNDPSANLTPLTDQQGSKSRLMIVYCEQDKSAMLALKNVAKTRGISVSSWQLPQAADIEMLKLSFIKLVEIEMQSEPKNKSSLCFNASNGNRQQLLSGYEIMRSYAIPIFIVDPLKDQMCWLFPESKPAITIKDRIKIHEFLRLNGCEVVAPKVDARIPTEQIELATQWLTRASKLKKSLAKLNYLALSARGASLTARMDEVMLADHGLQWLIDGLQQLGLVNITGKQVTFRDSETQFFCAGGWLERVTHAMVSRLAGEISELQDTAHSLEVNRKVAGQNVRNELDVVALVNNGLYVIECKTKQYARGEGNQVLYKLDSLAERLGGGKGRAALVTFYPISMAAKRRAKELHIEVFGPQQLANLASHLKRWLQAHIH